MKKLGNNRNNKGASAAPGYRINADDEALCNLLIFKLTNEKTDAQFDFISDSMEDG